MSDYAYVNRGDFPDNIDWSNAFQNFYGHVENDTTKYKSKKMKKLKILQKRVW